MKVPYDKSFAEFLRFLREAYPRAEYPEAFIPIVAHKATAGYAVEKYFPELIPEFLKRNGEFVYAISEPGWGNSPLNIKSRLTKNANGSYELYANKAFVLDGELGIFVARVEAPPSVSTAKSSVHADKEFALVMVDTDYYRNSRVPLDMPEATYRVSADRHVTHYRTEFTATLPSALYRSISKRDILLLSRTIVFREQIAYAVLAAAEAARHADMSVIESRVELLCSRAKEEPSKDDIAVAREILSASLVRILTQQNAHGFWKWLSRFAKPA